MQQREQRARAQEMRQLQIQRQIADSVANSQDREKLRKAREDQARAAREDQAAAESAGAERLRLMEIEVTIERAKNRKAGEAVTPLKVEFYHGLDRVIPDQ